jgi:hypothetical protein
VNRLAPMEAGTARTPFYQRGSFWLGPFAWGLGLVLAIGLAAAWYTLGGFPRDHDKYGEIQVPGQAVLALPAGDVRLNFENHATHSGDSTTLDDRPPGLDVRVTAAGGGAPLEIDDVPSWLFSSTSGSRGHEPYGKIDVPSAGDYVVQATDDASPSKANGGKGYAPLASQRPPPSVDSGPAISVGQSPWTPGDSKLLGAILCGVIVMGLVLAFTLPFRRFLPD